MITVDVTCIAAEFVVLEGISVILICTDPIQYGESLSIQPHRLIAAFARERQELGCELLSRLGLTEGLRFCEFGDERLIHPLTSEQVYGAIRKFAYDRQNCEHFEGLTASADVYHFEHLGVAGIAP